MTDLKFSVSGMTCGGCANSVRTILSRQFGVDKEQVQVDLDDAQAQVQLAKRPAADQLDAALTALNEHGFPSQLAG